MRLRRWRSKAGMVLLGLAIIAPPVAFGISNLFLASPKGRALIAGEIGNRLGLEASVEGATWSPWGGFTVYGIRVELPEPLRGALRRPLLSVQSVRIHPHWPSLLRKKVALRGVEIEKPEVHVPLELLSQIPHKEVPALAGGTDALAAADSAPPVGAISEPAPPSPPPESPAAPALDPPVAGEPPMVAAPPPQVETPNVWISVRGGKLRVVSLLSTTPLFEAEGINGSVPVSGKDAKSWISFSRPGGLGRKFMGTVTVPLEWKAPMLGTGVVQGELFGLDMSFVGHIALVKGMPFRIGASVPEQHNREIRIGGKVLASLGKVASQARTQGYLQAPASWQGQWIAHASSVDMELGRRKNRFDQGRAVVVFQNGALRCLDARLTSEEATIIGNGMILSDGRMAGNARVIGNPETLGAVSRFTQPDSVTVRLTPLSTPQRAALDLQIYGRPGNLFYKPNPMAAPILLR